MMGCRAMGPTHRFGVLYGIAALVCYARCTSSLTVPRNAARVSLVRRPYLFMAAIEFGPDDGPDLQGKKSQRTKETISSREAILKNTDEENIVVISQTLDWLQQAVIGLSLCPFADKPYREGKLTVEVLKGTDESAIAERIVSECMIRKTLPGTSLIVCPDFHPNDFEAFMDVQNMLQDDALPENDLSEHVQIAPFHPKFVFGGSEKDSPDNWTNRSPFPIFHILREDEVALAVDRLDGDAGKVWKRNVALLEDLHGSVGPQLLERLVFAKEKMNFNDSMRIKSVLRRIRSVEWDGRAES